MIVAIASDFAKMIANLKIARSCWSLRWRLVIVCAVCAMARPAPAQTTGKSRPPAKLQPKAGATRSVSLAPHFVAGQSFRYAMEFETDTATTRSGFASDPQAPSQVSIIWNARLRMDVLASDTADGSERRLQITYEKSHAAVRSDSFDPSSIAAERQYDELEGKILVFALNASGDVKSVSGLEGVLQGDKAIDAARQWILSLNAISGAPAGGVSIGQTWFSEQPATNLLLPGLLWRSDSEYLRDEDCHPANPDAAPQPTAKASEPCAVILTRLSLIRGKPARPSKSAKGDVVTSGSWNGSGESLSIVSLRTGMAVSITQDAAEDMDVTVSSPSNSAMRYAGQIHTRTQVALEEENAANR
jgi:hypothetical protein